MANSEAVNYYLKLQKINGYEVKPGQKNADANQKISEPYNRGRDPVAISTIIAEVNKNYDWANSLLESKIIVSWSEIAGETNAANSEPIAFVDKTLTVKCKSTAWATQLRMIQPQLISAIKTLIPEIEIKKITFLGPNAPSWRKGSRVVPGRGPRDTYG